MSKERYKLDSGSGEEGIENIYLNKIKSFKVTKEPWPNYKEVFDTVEKAMDHGYFDYFIEIDVEKDLKKFSEEIDYPELVINFERKELIIYDGWLE